MRPDHYATLGVDPDAKPAEIRAAYLALLRTYHPDRNPSPEAAERTQAIIAAFKILGDFDQRSYYDWDRRRDREAAEAAARAPRWGKRAGLAAGGLGLAAAGAWLLMPGPVPDRGPSAPTKMAAVEPGIERQPQPVAERRESRAEVIQMRPTLPKVAQPSATKPKAPPKPTVAKPVVREAAVKPVPRREIAVATAPVRAAAKPAPPIEVAARASPASPKAARLPSTEIASLDQFVMNFYGQSWRYGDAPKRAVLERTRASFVARRGACTGDTCRRNAYLDLMRDVSSIVETGKPEPR